MPDETSELNPVDAAVAELDGLLEGGRLDQALTRLGQLHPADQAQAIAKLDGELRAPLLPRIATEALAEIVGFLEEEARRSVVRELDPPQLGAVLDAADQDVAVDILHDLGPDRARAVMASMGSAAEIAPLLPHPDETAGGRMTRDFVALNKEWSVDQALSYLRRTRPDAELAYYLYAVDDAQRLEGVVSLRHLVVSEPTERIGDLMATEVVSVGSWEDQEETARRVQRYNFVAIPVVDEAHRLVGVVSVDDLMDVAAEEATEDMFQMVGLTSEETVFSSVPAAARRRIPWLLVNLATAFIGAFIVRLFEDTIADVAVLAVFMPVVAGHGGNTGTQGITLVVRALALGEVGLADTRRVIWKEARFGMIHGLVAGTLSAGLALVLTGNEWLALVVFCAMLGNIILAATVGSLLPLAMRRLGIDPALASAIWLTTFTDVMGFLLLLGLGSLLVERLN